MSIKDKLDGVLLLLIITLFVSLLNTRFLIGLTDTLQRLDDQTLSNVDVLEYQSRTDTEIDLYEEIKYQPLPKIEKSGEENFVDADHDYGLYFVAKMVQTECNDQDFESMTHVASVAYNRWVLGVYGSTPYEVIVAPNQFWYYRKPSQQAIDAVNYVWKNGDTAHGALYFNTAPTDFGRPLIFIDSAGHYFY